MNFLDALAAPLPAHLTAELLGAPDADAPEFASMVYGMSRGIGSFRPDQFPDIEASASELIDYVDALLADRRRAPRDDFLSDYVREADTAGQMDETEILMQIVSLIIAGSDTTRAGLTALLSLLLQHPDQWRAVCDDPALAEPAVLEALRFEPPVGSIGRLTTEPIDVGGVPIRAGVPLNLSILSAQRDPAIFQSPEQFNIRRTDHPRWSLTFGGGPHRCLGEALARAEMEETLIALSARLPGLRLIGDPPRIKGHTGIRGVSPMQVGWV
jgi:cytochrome P450